MSLALTIIGCGLLLAAGPPSADEQVRAAIQRSLPFIETEGQRWIEEKKCVTCHQVPFMVWSLNAAAERGIIHDRQRLADCSTWTRDWKNLATKEDLEKGEQHTLSRHHDPVTQLLLGRDAHDQRLTDGWPQVFAERLAADQQDDGSWKAGGQLPAQKRPERETQEVTTMWAMVALQSYSAADDSLKPKLNKARSWLGDQTEGQSTEWWAVRLLMERGAGNAAQADRIRAELLQRQRDDGGWGWLSADESDAFGTGVALYALAHDGFNFDHAAIGRGRQFLVATQRADGSWAVKGTKKAKAKQIEPTSVYWGTCWAVIGLAETLPK